MLYGMDPGKLHERVTIQQVTGTTTDSLGGQTAGSWADVSVTPNVWARIERLGSPERVAQDQLGAPSQYRVTLRYRDDVTEGMRLLWGSRTLTLTSAPEVVGERTQYITVMAAAE